MRRGIRFKVDPRDVPAAQAARRLGLTEAQFELVKYELYDRGFPRPDVTTGMYDLVAIDEWMNRRSNLTDRCDLTPARSARNAQEGFAERIRRLMDG